ncbi:S-adenosylmethionine:tRNA ribosyltransferase-isomerase [Streptomyces polyrhachis]|uniref:S-adenosylmethionine:tRNA ribosyltransferase-isomerase n=1 Tax=Streptomyces polyrhachis TaxID=1282885 RepID=A0ABW2GQN3_9ACTN
MITALEGDVEVPDALLARVPAEQRAPGAARDAVRLMVSRGARGGDGEGTVSHHAFAELPGVLRAGDVLVVNTSPTLPAAIDGRVGDEHVVVHFSTAGDDGRWAVELRSPDGRGTTRPRPGGPAGAAVRLRGGAGLVLAEPVSGGAGGGRLWWARVSLADVPGHLLRYGRPIRYSYTDRDQPLSAYQTVFAAAGTAGGGSAEMPSAGRPFTAELVARLVGAGVQFAPVTLHTGVSSGEAHEPPYPERYEVPEPTAWLVNAARAGGGRIVAVGTTAVRALESAADAAGRVRAAAGWTDLVVTPERGVRAVDGLLTGLHEPAASHLLMLEAVAGGVDGADGAAGRALLRRSYREALAEGYLWHEFGDVHLILG